MFSNTTEGVRCWPFLCVPLIHQDCTLGVLALNNFEKVGKGREHDAHPEVGVMQLLLDTGLTLGETVDTCRKEAALDALEVLVRDDPSIEVPAIYRR